jgi:hypothetical protein
MATTNGSALRCLAQSDGLKAGDGSQRRPVGLTRHSPVPATDGRRGAMTGSRVDGHVCVVDVGKDSGSELVGEERDPVPPVRVISVSSVTLRHR